MRPRDLPEAARVNGELMAYEAEVQSLPGLSGSTRRDVLIEQIIESERRRRFVELLTKRDLSAQRLNPSSTLFDPLRAAILHHRGGELEEACWLVFLHTHFGKHWRGGYRLAANVYGRLGGTPWTWDSVRADTAVFRDWLDENRDGIRGLPGTAGFGNHRKYESLGGWSDHGTGAVVDSYVAWVETASTHRQLIDHAVSASGGDAGVAFDALYRSMNAVTRFGRTARFDYLTTMGRIKVAEIAPASAYLAGATGSLAGARLLFGASGESVSLVSLDARLRELNHYLKVGFDVLEDSLCNWQKSPSVFKPFRG